MEGIGGGGHPVPRTVDEVFSDYKGRRAGLIKALTTGHCLLSSSSFLFSFAFSPYYSFFFFFLQTFKSFTSSAILVSSFSSSLCLSVLLLLTTTNGLFIIIYMHAHCFTFMFCCSRESKYIVSGIWGLNIFSFKILHISVHNFITAIRFTMIFLANGYAQFVKDGIYRRLKW
jgi:hypothetical protein